MTYADCEAELALLTERGTDPKELRRGGSRDAARAELKRYYETHTEKRKAAAQRYRDRKREKSRG